MKKIFVAMMVFGSVGTAMAQFGPMDPYAGLFIGPPEIWRQPGPSCGYTEKGEWRAKKYENSVSCESPWGSSPLAEPLRAFKRNHPNYKLMLNGREISGCNAAVQYDAAGIDPVYSAQNAANCNAVMAVPRGNAMGNRSGFADVFSAIGSFWNLLGVTTSAPIPAMPNAANNANMARNMAPMNTARACEWKADVEWVVTSRIPRPCCESANLEAQRAYQEIYMRAMREMERCMAASGGTDCQEKMDAVRKLAITRANAVGQESCKAPQCTWSSNQLSPGASGSLDGVEEVVGHCYLTPPSYGCGNGCGDGSRCCALQSPHGMRIEKCVRGNICPVS